MRSSIKPVPRLGISKAPRWPELWQKVIDNHPHQLSYTIRPTTLEPRPLRYTEFIEYKASLVFFKPRQNPTTAETALIEVGPLSPSLSNSKRDHSSYHLSCLLPNPRPFSRGNQQSPPPSKALTSTTCKLSATLKMQSSANNGSNR